MVLAQSQPELWPRMDRMKDAKLSPWPIGWLYLESSGKVSVSGDAALRSFSLSPLRAGWGLCPLPFSLDFWAKWTVAGESSQAQA